MTSKQIKYGAFLKTSQSDEGVSSYRHGISVVIHHIFNVCLVGLLKNKKIYFLFKAQSLEIHLVKFQMNANMVKSLSDINISTIKRDINLTSDEINCLDQDSKHLAINHLELTLLNLKKTLKQKFKCITCQEVFKSKNSLRKHKYIHTEKFQCKVCKAGFRDN